MQIRWGIIGTGYIANAFAKAMEAVDGAKVVAVASRTRQNAKAFAKEYKIEHAYGSYEELAEDEMIDAVYIATPHSEHFANASLAINNHKHVLCEKPMTLNARDTKLLHDMAKKEGVFLMEAMWTKFLPITKEVKGWIANDRIGTIHFMDAKFGFTAPKDPNSRLYDKELGGGALLDVGIYPIMYALELFGRMPDRIQSTPLIAEHGVDEINTVQFSYKDGPLVSMASAICANIGTDAVITGSDGKIVVYDFYGATKAALYDFDGDLIEDLVMPFEVNGYEYEIREVNQCIRNGLLESRIHPIEDTEKIMGVLDQIRQQWGLNYPGGK